MATAELAACLPVLVLILGVALGMVSTVSTRVRAQDAAREAARAAARGDISAAGRLARALAPGATVTITRSDDDVSVRVHTRAQFLGDVLPSIAVTGTAVAALEPDPSGSSP